MKDNNVVDLTQHRMRTDGAREPRLTQQDSDRGKVAFALLNKLRSTKRISKVDQPEVVGNIGRLVRRIAPDKYMALAEKVLGVNQWPKRKRYIRFPDEVFGHSARYAASGGAFAGIIDRLIDERVRSGFDRAQASITTIQDALKGTSFRRPSRFQMIDGASDGAYLVASIEKVVDKLAQDADLAEYFELISKYPIYPTFECPVELWKSESAILNVKREPNDLYAWSEYFEEEDELQNWIPWWAPKCVIGHLYVPFRCDRLRLSSKGIAAIKEVCGGEITPDNWIREDCSFLEEPFSDAERLKDRRAYHRLPVWLVVLPMQTGLIACLYTSFYARVDEFQIKDTATEGSYFSYTNSTTPCFVGNFGGKIGDDTVFFCGDEKFDVGYSYYVRISDNCIELIGPAVDADVSNFIAEAVTFDVSEFDFPPWLEPHPIQMLMKITSESDLAKAFLLSPRLFPKDKRYLDVAESETIFRSAFSESETRLTPLRQNTIGAYLLRNLADASGTGIFNALCDDVRRKAAAAGQAISGELSKFQREFDTRYDK